ncbi:MAG: SMP-30/gluconolactonase/LRE family protein [Pseudomonadota bacterium]|nr:SMP-30/gluconolactonase/LRE family protein [Pseudomonadota bacterium]
MTETTLPTDVGYEVYDPFFATMLDLDRPPEAIATGFIWTEGPVWLNDRLYFNDIPTKRMFRWTEQGGTEIAIADNNYANGNTLDLNGHMISCEHGGRCVLRRFDPDDPNGSEIIADTYEGGRLNSPNDVVVTSDGCIWFTDPPYGINSDIEGYLSEPEQDGCYVFRLAPNGNLTAVVTDFDKPNGLAFSPDESQIYIADSGAIRGASFEGIDYNRPHHIRVFDVKDGILSNGRTFTEIFPGVPDGFRVDHEGYIWSSALDGIHCIAQDGQLIGKILLPQQTSNLCFGGTDGTTMFITSSDKVYRVFSSRKDAAHKFLK